MEHEKLNYVEFAACDLAATKAFFTQVFSWEFVDYGAEYTSFKHQGLDGGFYFEPKGESQHKTSPLLVFYSHSLEQTLAKVVQFGGEITQEIFAFPGGRRFHFQEPSGNVLAVWSDK